jgi:Flp pilus assembly protein TadG
MLNRSEAKQNVGETAYLHPAGSVFLRSAVCSRSSRPAESRFSRGQSMVEFALISVFAFVVMLVGIQYALLSQAAVALNQGSSALARYASENPGTVGGPTGNGTVALTPAMEALLSPTIGSNGWGDLTVTIVSYQGNSATVTNTPQFGDRCVISFSYNTQSKIFVPNNSLGFVSLPTSLTASNTQLYQ